MARFAGRSAINPECERSEHPREEPRRGGAAPCGNPS